jgi:hypothetical protein
MGQSLVGVVLGLLVGATVGFALGELPGFRDPQVQPLCVVLAAGFGAVSGAVVGLAAVRAAAGPVRLRVWAALALVGPLWAFAIYRWLVVTR